VDKLLMNECKIVVMNMNNIPLNNETIKDVVANEKQMQALTKKKTRYK
jgi:hypothetical protein